MAAPATCASRSFRPLFYENILLCCLPMPPAGGVCGGAGSWHAKVTLSHILYIFPKYYVSVIFMFTEYSARLRLPAAAGVCGGFSGRHLRPGSGGAAQPGIPPGELPFLPSASQSSLLIPCK